jgi:xanthine/CO dehydrogenase XdhC/CoxF family maturation factor
MRWWEAGEAVALATVTATWSSAPRQTGAAMLVGPEGTVVGSVSSGCVEGAVYQLCREVAETGELTEAKLARLASPIGLDLGARTPEETAVSVAAEVVALRWGGTGTRLTDTEGKIHP